MEMFVCLKTKMKRAKEFKLLSIELKTKVYEHRCR